MIINQVAQWAALACIALFVLGLTRRLGLFMQTGRQRSVTENGPTLGHPLPDALLVTEERRVLLRARRVVSVSAVALVAAAGCGETGEEGSRPARDPDPAARGTPAGAQREDIAVVRSVATTFFRSPRAERAGQACVHLTGEEHLRLDRMGGCARVLNRSLGDRLAPSGEIVATGIRVDSQRGTARATMNQDPIRGTPPVIRLRREENCWRIFDTGL